METLEKVKSLELLEAVFRKQDYKDFLELVKDNQEQISRIGTYPIDNYKNKSVSSTHIDMLSYLYQNVKYYLQKKQDYTPKMQEGIAVFASKVAIMNAYYPGNFDSYFRVGDGLNHDICNPFEEIARLLLCVAKDEYWNNPNKVNNDYSLSFDKLRFEDNACLNVIKKALNGTNLKNSINYYYTIHILNAIEEDLESSNITSFNPLSATTKDNRDLMIEQINRLTDLYHMKVDAGMFVGDIPNVDERDKLVTRFNNRAFYAKRNMGIYEHTKRLVKEC